MKRSLYNVRDHVIKQILGVASLNIFPHLKPNKSLTILCIAAALVSPAFSQTKKPKIPLTYIEYNRGMNFPTSATIRINYPGHFDLSFHNTRLVGHSFYPDGSIFPNAFFAPLARLNIKRALYAFTEPYYGIRFYRFFKKNPKLGLGFEFIHLKVFIPDEGDEVLITGTEGGGSVRKTASTQDYISAFNVSHGVNHLSLSVVYREMLFRTERYPGGRLQPYAAISFGPALPHPQLRLKNDPQWKAYSTQMHLSNMGFGINLGLRLQIFKKLGLYVEYKLTRSFLRDLRFDNGEKGKVSMTFSAHHLAWGLSFLL
jgi:hypothetical protein